LHFPGYKANQTKNLIYSYVNPCGIAANLQQQQQQ